MVDTIYRLTETQANGMAGCWVDGAHGWRTAGHVVSIARDYGMPLTSLERDIVAHFLWSDCDALELWDGTRVEFSDVVETVAGQGELADRAEAYLNEHVAPEKWIFEWFNGDFVLVTDIEEI